VRRPDLAILGLSLLALLFGWETRQALRETPGRTKNTASTDTWQPGVTAPDPQPSPDPTPMAAAVAARPLFRPDRQPFHEQGASVRNYEAELARYSLLGVLGFGDAPYAVVVGKAGTKGERWEVKKGDSFQGFTVKEIGMEGMQLTTDGREFLLPLYAGAPTAAAGSRRTETPRRDAALPAPAPNAAAPASASGAAPQRPTAPPASASDPQRPVSPSASPLASRLRRTPTVPMAPGDLPTPAPSNTPPVVAPRYTPGSR
jgi:hypothetical protein